MGFDPGSHRTGDRPGSGFRRLRGRRRLASGTIGNDGTIAATITIDATGNATPKDVTVAAGSRVTFVNNHNAGA